MRAHALPPAHAHAAEPGSPASPAAQAAQAGALNRRSLLRALPLPALAALLPAGAARAAASGDALLPLLKAGGAVLAMRHALAPGTFDPPGFQLGNCSTQRNLNDEGRAQAKAIGAWFARQGLKPARVRSSPWCRCMDTATLAFGQAEAWAALGSPRGATEATNAESLAALRAAVQAASAAPGKLEVWVTHMFVLQDLVAQNTAVGEGLLLRADAKGAVQVLGRGSFG